MNLNEYQQQTGSTAVYPKNKAQDYLMLGLTSEVGELAGHLKRSIRGDTGISDELFMNNVRLELGDIMWYLAELANTFGINLEDVVNANVLKLSKRAEAGTIKGTGDHR